MSLPCDQYIEVNTVELQRGASQNRHPLDGLVKESEWSKWVDLKTPTYLPFEKWSNQCGDELVLFNDGSVQWSRSCIK